ncbi:MAG: hypothetical protein QNK37_38470 [Acidobacteriota bacterium]|nr:hypothetical protein [Acidobacteriota bacterium]
MTESKLPKDPAAEDVVQQFIEASREEAQRQAERESLRRKGFRVALFLAVVALFLAAMALFSRRAAVRQMEQAQLRRNQAEDLIDFMLVDLKNKLDSVGRLDILEDVGQKAMDYFATLPEDQLTGDSLLKQVRALHRIGEVRFKQNNKQGAMETFGQALAKAESLARRDPNNSDWQYELVVSYYWIAEVHRIDHNPKAAMPYCRKYLEVAQRMNQAQPDDEFWIYELACAYQNLAAIHDELGHWREALRFIEMNIPLTETLTQSNPKNYQWKYDLADSLAWRAKIQLEHGQLDLAHQTFVRSLDIQQATVEAEPSNQRFKYFLLELHLHLWNVYNFKGEVMRAIEHGKAALKINLNLVTMDPDNYKWKHALIKCYLSLVDSFRDLENWDKAEKYNKKALNSVDSFEGDVGRWKAAKVKVQQSMAQLYLEQGFAEQALVAVGSVSSESGKSKEDVILLTRRLVILAKANLNLGQHEKARGFWQTTLKVSGPKEKMNLFLQPQKALAYLSLNRADEARPLIDNLLQIGFREVSFWRDVNRITDYYQDQ